MTNKYLKVIDLGTRIIIPGCFVGAALCWGKIQYYQGRIDRGDEMNRELEKLLKTFTDLHDNAEEA